MLHSFTYCNQNSYNDKSLIIKKKNTYNGSNRNLSFVTSPGRSGDVILDNQGFSNINIRYDVYVLKTQDDFSTITKGLKVWLLSNAAYGQLYDSYDPDYFRYAVFNGGLEFTDVKGKLLETSLNFSCKPYRYSFAGQTKITKTSSWTINNPESFLALPYIKITGSGDVTLTIGSKAYAFTSIPTYLEVNSELMSCYKDDTLYNDCINFSEFPVLQPGNNTISWTGSVSKIEIIPNWRTL